MSEHKDRTNLSGGPDLDTAGPEDGGIRKEKESTSRRSRDADERSGAPDPMQGPTPSGDDPFIPGAPDVAGGVEPIPLDERERKAVEMQKHDPDGPSYEAHQDPQDHSTGGSIDPNDSLIEAEVDVSSR